MVTLRKDLVKLFVDRASQQWIVLDGEGNYWSVTPEDEDPWGRRQPFERTEDSELEPVPGHYKYMFRLPH